LRERIEMGDYLDEVEVVGIIGLGTMGRGITKACLASGVKVIALEIDEATAEQNALKVTQDLSKRVDKGKISKSAMGEMLSRLIVVEDLAEFSKTKFIIEAINEDAKMKIRLYKDLQEHTSPDTILCSNTSSLEISVIGRSVRDPKRFAGMHFFNPADVMKLVEVVKGKETSAETVAAVSAFAQRLGKTPIIVPDIPGFYVNRILFPMIVEGIRIKEITDGPSKDIDESMKLGAGLPMGPLELSDMIGNDVVLYICETLLRRTQDQKFAPPELLKHMVRDGKLGRKKMVGFHKYE
jgi:3-hydroxybutyryl-CoA dehydrogenase